MHAYEMRRRDAATGNGAVKAAKIVLINRYFYPDESATSRIVYALADALTRHGHTVLGVASRHLHNDPAQHLAAIGRYRQIPIHRLATSCFGRSRLLGRAFDYATFHLSAAFWVLRHVRRDDVVVVCTDPPLLSATLSLPLRIKRAVVVNWLHDLFPEVAIELGVIGSRPLAAAAKALRDWSLRRAHCNVAPTDSMAGFLAARHISADRLAVLPYWSDGEAIRPIAPGDNALRREWGLQDAIVVGYSGNFGRAHEFGTILDAAERLRDDPRIRFLLIGDGHQRAHVESAIRERGLTNVMLKPLQPRERLAESLCAADLHLVSLLPALEPFVIPSKFYGILAAGRPTLFIGDADGEIGRVVKRHDCGLSIAIGDGDGLAGEIRDLAASPDRRAALARNGRALFEAHHTEAQGTGAWAAFIARHICAIGTATQALPMQTSIDERAAS